MMLHDAHEIPPAHLAQPIDSAVNDISTPRGMSMIPASSDERDQFGSATRPTYGATIKAPITSNVPAVESSAIPQESSVLLPTKAWGVLSSMTSLDSLIKYREERAFESSGPSATTIETILEVDLESDKQFTGRSKHQHGFRHISAEVGFCFTIAMAQFLGEYLISGFAIELPRLLEHQVDGGRALGQFWPASLLSLTLSATLLVFARLSDMYGGYASFMGGVIWLVIWTLPPCVSNDAILLDVSRAMQGVAIAAFTPSAFAMVGSIYPEGPRRNFVLGLYSGCAPLGFFGGLFVAAALPPDASEWYFGIVSILATLTVVVAYLSVPHDRTNRKQLGLSHDWIGSFLIITGLLLVAYALAYVNTTGPGAAGFASRGVLAPFLCGIACLIAAFWIEGWVAACPLLPFVFFKPRGVLAFSIAALCFYASYGVWLYVSTEMFESQGIVGIRLALWYVPTALAGLVLCVVGGAFLHLVHPMALLLLSGVAWIGAPLLLAFAPQPLQYWSFVLVSMLCATLGIDLTYTVSVIFLSSVEPLQYQGLSGAVCSILINLAMAFSLPVSEMVGGKVESSMVESAATAAQVSNRGHRASLVYGAVSAAVGLIIAVIFVRISRRATNKGATSGMASSPTNIDEPGSGCLHGTAQTGRDN